MKQKRVPTCLLGLALTLIMPSASPARADDGYRLWLKFDTIRDEQYLMHCREAIGSVSVSGSSETCRIVRDQLKRGLGGLLGRPVTVETRERKSTSVYAGTPRSSPSIRKALSSFPPDALGSEGYWIGRVTLGGRRAIVLAAREDIGLLYGAFHLLRLIQTHRRLDSLDIVSRPAIQYRLLDHWDNRDGSIERGYAGKSLWKWDELPGKLDDRYRDYACADASIGINGAVLNNVNASPAMLENAQLRKVAVLADVFRPYGIRVFLSVNFASPMSGKFELEGNRVAGIGKLPTCDPLDPAVRSWWKEKVKEIYRLIPDFGGFLVKANSEGMPGPLDYHRSHADGANMLAEALAPFHGIVMWRAFVYNADVDPDRVKRSYLEFVPLDGKFRDNVFIQPKNGPLDFQPREPVQPLFGAMPRTPLMLELQVTQEYLGHSTHLVYLAPMWQEYLHFDTYARGPGSTLASIVNGTLEHHALTGIAGVANTGDDRNWCGHFFAQANWFAFGRLAWDQTLTAEEIADDWIRMSISSDPAVIASIRTMMMGSWEACINYMTPLGLHHIMQVDFHYGPGPANDKGRQDWTSVYYHRADSVGLGFDRSSTGSNAVSQYHSPLKERFDNLETCPEKYLLWFHHVRWDQKLTSGRTLWEELCSRYYAGTAYVDSMYQRWNALKGSIDPGIFSQVEEKLERQRIDAGTWRDTCLEYFQLFSNRPIVAPSSR